jgi:cell shape-determining protein MreC
MSDMRYSFGLFFLMFLSAVSAVLMPPRMGDSLRKTSSLFIPVSLPVRVIAGSVDARLVKPDPTPSAEVLAGRTTKQLHDDITTLNYQVNQLISENNLLQEKLDLIGALDTKTPVKLVHVFAADLGAQQVLTMQVSAREALAPGTPAMYPPKNLAGKVEIVGLGAASVRLITDRASVVTGEFRRYQKDTGQVRLRKELKNVAGTGNGRMVIEHVKRDEAFPPGQPGANLAPGDWLVVNDKDFPAFVQGWKIGEIESFRDSKREKGSGFVDIIIRPEGDLMKLVEVMVPIKK